MWLLARVVTFFFVLKVLIRLVDWLKSIIFVVGKQLGPWWTEVAFQVIILLNGVNVFGYME